MSSKRQGTRGQHCGGKWFAGHAWREDLHVPGVHLVVGCPRNARGHASRRGLLRRLDEVHLGRLATSRTRSSFRSRRRRVTMSLSIARRPGFRVRDDGEAACLIRSTALPKSGTAKPMRSTLVPLAPALRRLGAHEDQHVGNRTTWRGARRSDRRAAQRVDEELLRRLHARDVQVVMPGTRPGRRPGPARMRPDGRRQPKAPEQQSGGLVFALHSWRGRSFSSMTFRSPCSKQTLLTFGFSLLNCKVAARDRHDHQG